jgi:hypothetical protein
VIPVKVQVYPWQQGLVHFGALTDSTEVNSMGTILETCSTISKWFDGSHVNGMHSELCIVQDSSAHLNEHSLQTESSSESL